jgi:uncharacterized protein (TIGR00369 family)
MDNSEEASGLQQLQLWIASGKRFGIGESLQFDLVEAGDGFAAFEGIPGDHAYNPIGSVHGGYSATLLDSACGCAVHSKLAHGVQYTTLELKVSYHKAITRLTGRVRAEAIVLSIGRRAAFAEAKLFDAGRKLLASATSTLLVMSK